MDETRVLVPIEKISDPERLFGGWAYVAVDKHGHPVEDHSGDVVDTREAWDALRKALIEYAVEIRKGDDMHTSFEAADLVELFIIDEDRREMLGIPDGVLPERAAWVTFKALDTDDGNNLWDAITRGDRKALSIVGVGRREPIE